MKKFLEQFKNLNTRDPGAWPPIPKAMLLLGVLVGIVALGYFLDWQEEMDSLEAGAYRKRSSRRICRESSNRQSISIFNRQQLRENRQLLRRASEGSCPIDRKWTRCSWTSTRLGSVAACNLSCSGRLRRKPSVNSTPSCRSR